MIAILTAVFSWALKNQMITGLFAFLGSKIYLLVEDYIKRRFFPIPMQTKTELEKGKPIVKKQARQKDINFAKSLLKMIFALLVFYTFITYQQFPYLKHAEIVEELEKIKLFAILFTIFLAAKLLSFNTTLKELGETLPLIKKFLKR